jgi:hypothetical protein
MADTTPDETAMPPRSRVALVVFADVDGEIGDGWALVQRVLMEKLGEPDGTEHPVTIGGSDGQRTFNVRFHDYMEAGMAAGNGYLWTRPTAKAFKQWQWQFEGEER